MAFELEGKLIKKFDTQNVSATFQKREFVVETSETYPQKIKFELTKEKCSLLDSVNEQENVKVQFNINGREWLNPKTNEVNYFTSLQAWRIESSGSASNSGSTSGGNSSKGNFPPPTEPITDNGYGDDLPF